MYHALYKFQSNSPDALSFEVDDLFTVLEKQEDQWWLVQDGNGRIAYAPANYLAPDNAAHADVLKSIEGAIESIHRAAALNNGKYTDKQKQSLKMLQIHKTKVIEEFQLKQTNSSLKAKKKASSTMKNTNIENELNSKSTKTPRRIAPATPVPVTSTVSAPSALGASSVEQSVGGELTSEKLSSQRKQTFQSDNADVGNQVASELLPSGLSNELVEQMRNSTSLSYEMSKTAVASVLTLLGEKLPTLTHVMDKILQELFQSQENSLDETNDAVQLRKIFSKLAAAKDDSQQRSWFLHEDEETICNLLQDLITILNNANPLTSRHVLSSDGYAACQDLVVYYQMETRLSIRLLLLQSFGSMCSLDVHIISELLNSVLPLELARDIQSSMSDAQKMTYSALVLAMIFSSGEVVPQQHYAHLNIGFIEFLLQCIESPSECTADPEKIMDVLVKLLLSFNLHFELPEENVVMKALASRGNAKLLTEQLMLLFNREEDPVKMFEHKLQVPNSVLKFFSDIFSSRSTSNLLYTNDEKVLIDIILRQLTDLSSDDKMRTEYLSLMHLILLNSEYFDHRHRQTELQGCLQRIQQEENETSMDKDIVKQIWTQFPNDFSDNL